MTGGVIVEMTTPDGKLACRSCPHKWPMPARYMGTPKRVDNAPSATDWPLCEDHMQWAMVAGWFPIEPLTAALKDHRKGSGMSKFTPGPWFAAPYSSVVGIGIVGKGGRVICSVAVQPGFNPNGPHEGKREIAYADEVRATAHAIAAMPELHDSIDVPNLRSAARLLAEGGHGLHAGVLTLMADKQELALAKARGTP